MALGDAAGIGSPQRGQVADASAICVLQWGQVIDTAGMRTALSASSGFSVIVASTAPCGNGEKHILPCPFQLRLAFFSSQSCSYNDTYAGMRVAAPVYGCGYTG